MSTFNAPWCNRIQNILRLILKQITFAILKSSFTIIMTSSKGNCRLCSTVINNENYELMTDSTIDISNALLIKLDVAANDNQIICNTCSGRLTAAFEFKSTCLYVNSVIVTYNELEKPRQSNLRDIYLKERENKRTVMLSEDDKICRLCLELTGKMFLPFDEVDIDILQKLFPEVNVHIIKDPVICKSCFDAFISHGRFLKNCFDIQRAIKKDSHKKEPFFEEYLITENVSLKSEDEFINDSCIKTEEIKIEQNELMSVKLEEIGDHQPGGTFPTSESHPMALVKSIRQIKSTKTVKCKWQQRSYLTHSEFTTGEDFSGRRRYSCDSSNVKYKNFSKVQMYKCGSCNYETRRKHRLKTHELIHKDASQVHMYKCDVCNYETKFKGTLKRHQLTHKDLSQLQMYKCDTCDYRTIYKGSFQSHQLKHKDPSQVQMYQCENCDFKSIYKNSLKKHLLIHKDPAELQMHKCDICGYETKFKGDFKTHQVTHKDPAELQMHKCEICNFETKFKYKVKRHQLIHKDPSQVQMYNCDNCNFKTFYKNNFKKHQIIHKELSQMQIHKCNICEYTSRFKNYLKRHQLIHKDLSQV